MVTNSNTHRQGISSVSDPVLLLAIINQCFFKRVLSALTGFESAL